ncbi:galactokinase [Tropicimonas sp. IMCC6043]|uniref:galactokinase n=1 Tax=Tropicimonas sp. IMCC6043 TaxID=2510645 RepID=UPI00101D472D|nr:galactokinase [Tropicimonas sp. IMCC6043]RYH10329.1 galactokinase [Tropicimonas sp. IMCC6043]
MTLPPTEIAADVAAAYAQHFGRPPEVTTFAPGRVNLLGEHTDYNGGYVLPMPLEGLGVAIAIGHGPAPGAIEAYSDTFHEAERRNIEQGREGRWSDYVLGCLKAVATSEIRETGLRIALITTLPMGAGLSSSAALEVATLRAATTLFGKETSPVDIAVAARAVENDFVGMPCGIMDQFASAVGKPGNALFLNTRTLEYAPAPLPESHRFLILHSGVSHQLTQDGYANRVAECTAACEALGVEMLSDLGSGDLDRLDELPELLARRTRHVLTDNQRVLDGLAALKAGDPAAFGRLMTESHASQRDDYAITVPETDALVAAALEAGALGARQTGGGFGGAVVALVAEAEAEDLSATLLADFPGVRRLALV